MCGISGILSINMNIVDILYKSLFNLQHRGQESSGFIFYSSKEKKNFKSKQLGLVDEHINDLIYMEGNMGLGHVRYPTSGIISRNEIQPFSISKPYGVSLVHNGNIINKNELIIFLNENDIYMNSTSDSEIILNLFYYFIDFNFKNLNNNMILDVIKKIYQLCKGSFSIIIMIHGFGLISFRDKYGIRPLVYNINKEKFMIASESVGLDDNNRYIDVCNGEVLIVDMHLNMKKYKLFNENIKPCIFEYIYFASPESYINNVLVYNFRAMVGKKIASILDNNILNDIDIVVPVPLTSLIYATSLAETINKPLKHAILKNRYTHRTFINSGNNIINNIKKIKIIKELVHEKNILVVDDSIVRGNTCKYIIDELRKTSVNKIYLVSCSPPVKYPNIYGINIPTYSELIANNKSVKEIEQYLNVDKLYYLSLQDMECVLNTLNNNIKQVENSTFTGNYINF